MREFLRDSDSDQSETSSDARLFAMQACFKLSVKLAYARRLGVCQCELASASLPACQRDQAEPGMPARGSGCLPVCSLSEPQAICANLRLPQATSRACLRRRRRGELPYSLCR